MDETAYTELLGWIAAEYGGIGPVTIDSIRETFPDGDAFVSACRAGYNDLALDALTEIHGIGEGYARHKLAMGAAEYYGWEDGDAEPIPLRVHSFDELVGGDRE